MDIEGVKFPHKFSIDKQIEDIIFSITTSGQHVALIERRTLGMKL